MPVVSEQSILEALKTIAVNNKSIVDQNLVGGISISEEKTGSKVSFIVQVAPGQNAEMERVKKEAEEKIKSLEGVNGVSVILTAHQTPPQREPHVTQKISLPGVKFVVAVASGKGGVGKSTTSVNLAAALVQNGLKVGLLDADIYGPSIPRMLGVNGKPQARDDKKLIPHERYGLRVMSMGFLIAEETPMIWRGPMVHSAITQLFRDVVWGDLDILVVDLPPGTGDAQLTMAQSAPLSGAVIVSTPQDIALLDARKGLGMFEKVGVPVLGIVENMSFFLCPHCGERSDIFSHGGARLEAEKLRVPFLGEIPLNIKIREKSDEGMPLTLSDPDSEIAKLYREMASTLWKTLSPS